MPPKADSTSLTPDSTRFLLSTLLNCETIKPDWNAVVEENGIKFGRNARSRFIAIIKQFGLGLEGEKMVKLDASQARPSVAGAQAAIPNTPTKRKSNALKTPPSKKKNSDPNMQREEVKEEIDNQAEEEL